MHQKLVKKSFLSPKKVIEKIAVAEGETVIDFGCGSGFWSVLLAKKVGSKGRVIAIDAKEENLSLIARSDLANVKLFQAPYSLKALPVSDKADVILFANVLSFNKYWKKLIESVPENSKKGTRLVVIDWAEEKFLTDHSRCESWVEDIILTARKKGFTLKRMLETGDFHFGLYFEYEGGK